MRKVSLFLALALMIGVVALPLGAQDDMVPFPSEHTECDVDLTGETITLYHFGDISGPLAAITTPIVSAYTDAIAYFTEQGTLCGAALTSQNDDTGGSLDTAQALYERYKEQYGLVALNLYSSGDSELLRGQLAEDEILVNLSAGSYIGLYGEDGQSPGWIFATNPLYVDQLGSFCEFLADNPDQYPDPVIGYISWPTTFGQAAWVPEALDYCESLGVQFTHGGDGERSAEIFAPADPDVIVQVQNLLDQGANILYTNTLASFGPGKVAAAIADLGIAEEVTLAGVNWVMDISAALTSQGPKRDNGLPVLDGMLGSVPFVWWTETDHPGIQFLTQQADLNERGPGERNVAYLLSWANIDLTIEVYIQTLNRVGSLGAITGAELKETYESVQYEPMGGIYIADWEGGAIRDLGRNRIAVMRFLNADGTGPATSADDALTIMSGDTELFIPLIIPLTDWQEVANVHPGAPDAPGN